MKDHHIDRKHINPTNRGILNEFGILYTKVRTRPEGRSQVMGEQAAKEKNNGPEAAHEE